MFNNLSVGKKIWFGFGVIMGLLVVVATVVFFSLNKASNGFTEYREMARDANLSGRLQANMLMVRMNVKDFFITGSDHDLKQYNEYWKKMETFQAEAQKEIQNKDRAAKIDMVENNLKDYKEGFAKVVEYIHHRNENVKDILDIKGPFMEKTLTEVMESANRDKDMVAAYYSGLAMKHLLLARLYMAKFLDTNDKRAVDRVNEEFTKMQNNLDVLDRELQNPRRRKLLASVITAKDVYKTTFDDLVQTIFERNKIITGTLDRIGPEIAKAVEDVKLDIKGVQDELGPQLVAANRGSITMIVIISVIALALGVFLSITIGKAITGPLNNVIQSLTNGAEQVSSASEQLSSSSQQMSEGSSEQASSLEEVSSSLEEMSSMTKQNAESSKQANIMASNTNNSAQQGKDAMIRMAEAIDKIKSSSDETAKIIKTIDEIAMQTNLLALNAAVEAARAGEAGRGFAVVAEEVRNLAQRSAEAAKNTADLIEGSQKNSENGVSATTEVSKILEEIIENVKKVTQLIAEVSAASAEQANGIDQVTTSVAQMDKVTQQNAANAEESASSSEELSSQAQNLNAMVNQLASIVGSGGSRASEITGSNLNKQSFQGSNNLQVSMHRQSHNLRQSSTASPVAVERRHPNSKSLGNDKEQVLVSHHSNEVNSEQIIPFDDDKDLKNF